MSRPPDERAFEKILESHTRLIVAKIRSLEVGKYGLDEDDLLQEIRLRIWRICEDGWSRIRNERAYISKVVLSVALREINKVRGERALVKAQGDELSARKAKVDDPDKMLGIRASLARDLGRIRPSRRDVIMLCLRGFSLEEIAELKRYTRAKTRHLYYRGLAELKRKMKKEGRIR